MKSREFIAWSIVAVTYVFLAISLITGMKIYPIYAEKPMCEAVEIRYPVITPTK